MKRTLLVNNSNSGNANAVEEGALASALEAAGFGVVGRASLPDDDLPSLSDLMTHDIQTLAICAGDGTVSSMCAKLADWSGDVLVLPGGTMNLLSRHLHGEHSLPELLELLPNLTEQAQPVPIIRAAGHEIYTGLTVGPSTHWGEVREGIRQADLGNLRETVSAAWSETLGEEGVWLENAPREAYAGIFIEPFDAEKMNVIAFKANSLGDMVNHGLAWLRKDFREGPRDELGIMPRATVIGDHMDTGILVDGEYEDSTLPLTCTASMSSVRFLRIAP